MSREIQSGAFRRERAHRGWSRPGVDTEEGPLMLVHRNQPDRGELAECAYLVYLGQGSSDELANWLRTEREVKAD